MSIADLDKVDGVGISRQDNNTLVLMLSDHFDWEDEEVHLIMLQDKINVYLEYIQTKQYISYYKKDFSKFIIDISFRCGVTENCSKFLDVASKQLNSANIFIQTHIG